MAAALGSGCLAAGVDLGLGGFFALPAHHAVLFDLLVLEQVHVDHASHVCVVGSLVIVRQQSSTIVVCASILRVESPLQVTFEFVVVGHLFVDLPQTGVVKCLRVVREYLSVVSVGELRVPLLRELEISLWQRPHKLIVHIQPVVHAVVSDDRLFSLNHCLNDK